MFLLHFIREIIGIHPSDGTSDDETSTEQSEKARMIFLILPIMLDISPDCDAKTQKNGRMATTAICDNTSGTMYASGIPPFSNHIHLSLQSPLRWGVPF
jgi:hypothetical protein